MKKIRLNITDFKTIIDNDYYYVDKSLLIKDVLNEKVVFYIRPKGFGKSLNMSMLYYFFSINESNNSYLFEQLKISQDKKAKLHQNKYLLCRIQIYLYLHKDFFLLHEGYPRNF